MRIIALTFSLLNYVACSKILAVIPTAFYSHQAFYRQLWLELASRGHELTLITTDPIKNITEKNLIQVDLSIMYAYQDNFIEKIRPELMNANKFTTMKLMLGIMEQINIAFFSQPEIKKFFKDKSLRYDLLMLECIAIGTHTFIQRFEAPTICLSSMDAYHGHHRAMGNPTNYVLYPNANIAVGPPQNFLNRLVGVCSMFMLDVFINYFMIPETHQMLMEILEVDYPFSLDMVYNYDMFFTNMNPVLSPLRALSPAMVSLAGGLHHRTPQALPEDIKEFLDGAPHGVIYMSFGSHVNWQYISPSIIEAILKALSQVPQKVLWKWELDVSSIAPSNVMTSKWVPQQDVLRHENVKLFVTQAGAQSIEEALFAEIPMVAIPFFGDQYANAEQLAEKGLGLQLDHITLTAGTFLATISEVMNNEKYKEQVTKFAYIARDQAMPPLEKALWWTEYVLRHKGAKHLHGPTIPNWQFYYLDIFALFGVVSCFMLFLMCKIVKLVYF